MAYSPADRVAQSDCEYASFIGGSSADIVVGRDSGYYVELQGCRVRVALVDGVLRADSEQCEPLSPSLEFLRSRVYERLELDAEAGTLAATFSSLGPESLGTCGQLDGQIRKAGTTGAIAWNSTIWAYVVDTLGVPVEPPGRRLQGLVEGYLVDQPDGSVFVWGLSCTLPGRTAPGVTGTLDADACPSRFAGAHGVPRFRPTSYTLTDTEFTLQGTFDEATGPLSYTLTSDSLDQDPRWDGSMGGAAP